MCFWAMTKDRGKKKSEIWTAGAHVDPSPAFMNKCISYMMGAPTITATDHMPAIIYQLIVLLGQGTEKCHSLLWSMSSGSLTA